MQQFLAPPRGATAAGAAGSSPDDLFRATKEIQDVTNACNEDLAKIADAKKAEISAAGGSD